MSGRICAMAISMAIVTAACGGLPEETDAATPLEAGPGDAIEVVLRSNASTGYRWRIAEAPDTAVLRAPAEGRYRGDPRMRNRDGAGGVEEWTFTANRAGRTGVALQYVGPSGDHVAETRRFTFVVRE